MSDSFGNEQSAQHFKSLFFGLIRKIFVSDIRNIVSQISKSSLTNWNLKFTRNNEQVSKRDDNSANPKYVQAAFCMRHIRLQGLRNLPCLSIR